MATSSSHQTEEGTFRVLHVDDEPELSEMVGIFLRRADERFEIVQATSASMGLDQLSQQTFDCVISDYDMPGCNGIEFLEKVRKKFRNLPFILFTGKGTEEIASDAISAGVTDYLQKQTCTDQYTVLANSVSNAIEQEKQRRRYEAVFNQTYQFTGLLDPDGTVLEANNTVLEFGGLDRDEIVGQKMWELQLFQYSQATRERAQSAVERAADGDSVHHELHLQGADRVAIIDFSVRPVIDEQGSIIFLVPEGHDITERKEHEQAVQRERDQLNEFAGVVSHDIRNPLTVAEGRLELAQQECESDHFSAIEKALNRIDRITEDVLWLAHEGRDLGSIDAVVLHEMIDTTWNIVADCVADAELHYVDDDFSTITIEADDDRLCQLLENLFGNAIEHGGEDVTVTVGAVDDGFYIEDDGPGIPEESRDDVFTAGYSTGEDGTGFGLSIVKRIAEAHEWEIHVLESAEGGVRFEITGVEFVTQ